MENERVCSGEQIWETEVSLPLSSLPPWPFTPLPEFSPTEAETDDSFIIPELPPWPFTPLPPWSESGSIVEETDGIWDLEAAQVPKSGEMKAGSEARGDLKIRGENGDLEVGSEAKARERERIARLQGWEGPMGPITLEILEILLPAYFRL